MPEYLPSTYFNDRDYYRVAIDKDGLTVESECCMDDMSLETAKAVHEALGRWLADQEKED